MRLFFARIARFFRELKRRKVYQVAGLYAVLVVGGMEVLDLQVPASELPEWTTVAVLPFDNLSGSDEAEPFAMGLHDDLLTELYRVSVLNRVAALVTTVWRPATGRRNMKVTPGTARPSVRTRGRAPAP